MIRAMIGTVAVLAGFAVVERSVDASTGQAGSCTPTDAYALMQPGESVPVRAEPALHATVVGTLRGEERTVVRMSASQGGWARVSITDGVQPYGWVPADLLRVDAKMSSSLYSRPGPMGQKLATLDGEAGSFRLLGCRGNWLHVINARTGSVWIDKWCAKDEGCRG